MTTRKLAIPFVIFGSALMIISVAVAIRASRHAHMPSTISTPNDPAMPQPDSHNSADDLVGTNGGQDNIDTCEDVEDNLRVLFPITGADMDCQHVGGTWFRIEVGGKTRYALIPTTTKGVDVQGSLLHFICQAICLLELEVAPDDVISVDPDSVLFLTTTIVRSGKVFSTRAAWSVLPAHTRLNLGITSQMSIGQAGLEVRRPGFGLCDLILADKVTISGVFEGDIPFSLEFDPRGLDASTVNSSVHCSADGGSDSESTPSEPQQSTQPVQPTIPQ